MTLSEWKDDFKRFVKSLEMPRDDYKRIMEYIDDVPESHWISCSERLPNKEGEYLVTDVAGGVETVEVDMLLHYEDDGKPFWCYSQNPIAWCEKPEPYKEVTT